MQTALARLSAETPIAPESRLPRASSAHNIAQIRSLTARFFPHFRVVKKADETLVLQPRNESAHSVWWLARERSRLWARRCWERENRERENRDADDADARDAGGLSVEVMVGGQDNARAVVRHKANSTIRKSIRAALAARGWDFSGRYAPAAVAAAAAADTAAVVALGGGAASSDGGSRSGGGGGTTSTPSATTSTTAAITCPPPKAPAAHAAKDISGTLLLSVNSAFSVVHAAAADQARIGEEVVGMLVRAMARGGAVSSSSSSPGEQRGQQQQRQQQHGQKPKQHGQKHQRQQQGGQQHRSNH
jgi:hypothetical protein